MDENYLAMSKARREELENKHIRNNYIDRLARANIIDYDISK